MEDIYDFLKPVLLICLSGFILFVCIVVISAIVWMVSSFYVIVGMFVTMLKAVGIISAIYLTVAGIVMIIFWIFDI